MKKIIALMLCCALCATALIGCAEKNKGSSDPVVVDVRIYKAGYGTEWFKSAKERFETLYKDKGYSINIVEESYSMPEKVFSEIQNKKSNSVDLYITGDSDFSAYLKLSKSVLKSTEEVLLENLNDVYSSPAIRFDGTEESVTIESKLNESAKRFMQYQGTTSSTDSYLNNFKGNYYAFPWASGVAGLLVNKSVFENYGLELPRTTDELLAAYAVMCPNNEEGKPTPKTVQVVVDEEGNTEDFSAYPMIYAGDNGAGFWMYVYDTFFAQYSGTEAEKNFWACEPKEGSMAANGYDVYKDQGRLESLKVVEKLCDNNYCPTGTASATEISAQQQVLLGNAAIMPTGNWIYCQMKEKYSSIVDNATMLKTPIISALGVKLGITDATLSAIVKGVDEGKADSVIAAECSATEAIVKRVREAREIYFDASVNSHIALIPSYSSSKDVAKLFLRFLASDDNLDLYKSTAYSSLPFKYAGESKVSDNDFVKSVDEAMGYGKNVLICEDLGTSDMRQKKVGLHCFANIANYKTVFKGLSNKEFTAQSVYENDITTAESEWAAYKKQAGIKD